MRLMWHALSCAAERQVPKWDDKWASLICGYHVCVPQFGFYPSHDKAALQHHFDHSLLSVTPVLFMRCRMAPSSESITGLYTWISAWTCTSSFPDGLAGILCSASTRCVRLCAAQGTVVAARVSSSLIQAFWPCGGWWARNLPSGCPHSEGHAQCRWVSGSHFAAQLWLPCIEAGNKEPKKH